MYLTGSHKTTKHRADKPQVVSLRSFWLSGRVNGDPDGPAPRAVELGQEHALPAPEVGLSTPHQETLRLPKEAGEEVRVAVAFCVLEGDVQPPDQRPARSG